jgi:hypothetical protein
VINDKANLVPEQKKNENNIGFQIVENLIKNRTILKKEDVIQK